MQCVVVYGLWGNRQVRDFDGGKKIGKCGKVTIKRKKKSKKRLKKFK